MSEPLSREDVQQMLDGPYDGFSQYAWHQAAQAMEARVAELEEDGHEGWIACEEEQARADRAEAGLAAAQEALKASVGFWIATPDDLLEAPLSPAEHERLILVRDALARGGGQQETGQ